MSGSACNTPGHFRQGVPPNRESDTGKIPTAMLDDLRHLLWKMEKLPMYWGIGMAIIIGAAWTACMVLFITADQRHPDIDRTSISLGMGALTVLAALLYSPFCRRWFYSAFDAKYLREVLYPERLEHLSSYMASCRIGSEEKTADDLLAIWVKHGVEPGWMARPAEPKPQFK